MIMNYNVNDRRGEVKEKRMNTCRVVIVGGGLAGLRVADRLHRTAEVVLVGAEPHAPYDRPPLSKALLTQEIEPAAPPLLPADGLELRAGVHASGLDTGNRDVLLDNGTVLGYDHLVIATGLRPRRLFDGWSGVHVLRTWEDCVALRAGLRSSRHVTVVGGGVLGCEIAASASTLRCAVTVVELLDQPLAAVLGAEIGSVVAELHRERGVDVRCATRVERLEGDGRVERVVLSDGSAVDTDLVVVAAGAVPNTEWLSGVDVTDGVVCDEFCHTSAENVWAAGDVARLPHGRLEHWTSASDTAAVVARNVLAPRAEWVPLTAVPYFWTDQYDAKIQCLGMPGPELMVVDGSLAEGRFLAHYTRAGVVTGAVAIGMPAALARCRRLIGSAIPLQGQ